MAEALLAQVGRAARPDPIFLSYLHELASMPTWCQRGRLDEWEARLLCFDLDRDIPEAVDRSLVVAAKETFGLGRYNMYAAIEQDETVAEFERVRQLLSDAGVQDLPDTAEFDFGEW